MRRSSPVLPTTSRSPGSWTGSSPRRNLAAPTPPASATSMAGPLGAGPGAVPRIATAGRGRRAGGGGLGGAGRGGGGGGGAGGRRPTRSRLVPAAARVDPDGPDGRGDIRRLGRRGRV